MYQEYIKNVDYIKYYRLAVELAVIYLIALYEVYIMLKQGKDFTDKHKRRFLKIVSDADLSCPLTQKIFEKAYAALSDQRNMTVAIKTEVSDLLIKTKFLSSTRIFKAKSDKNIVKA